MKITSEECEWCNGTGTDTETFIYKGCPDCEGTGYKYKIKGREKYIEEMNRIDEQINWTEVDKYK